jgi:AraC-like DNA-binding protein
MLYGPHINCLENQNVAATSKGSFRFCNLENETFKGSKLLILKAFSLINDFLLIMSLCGFVLGIVACSVLLFSNKSHLHANRLLAVSLFGLTVVMLVTFLYQWNIDYYAYIYRFPGPLYYLIMPGAYLYVRAVINDEAKLRKRDFIHILPAFLRLLELGPFYFTSYAYRRSLVERLVKDPDNTIKLSEGILPPYSHTILLSALGIIYLGLMIVTIKRAGGIQTAKLPISRSWSFKWLKAFTTLIAVISLPIIFMAVFSQPHFIDRSQLLLSTVCLSFLVINLFLFFQPEILYGIPRVKLTGDMGLNVIKAPEKETKQEEEADMLTNEEMLVEESSGTSDLAYLETYKPVLELYLASSKPFLKQGYSIFDLARETNIPQHHLSALLNRLYRMRFTEFMNRMRIDYIIENFGGPQWGNLTLEGIAKQAGFNSRTTFFNSIKKATGLAPSEFLENIKTGQTTPKVRKDE